MAFRTQIVGSDLADLADNQQLCAEMRSLNHKWKPGMPESEKYIVTRMLGMLGGEGGNPTGRGELIQSKCPFEAQPLMHSANQENIFWVQLHKKSGLFRGP